MSFGSSRATIDVKNVGDVSFVVASQLMNLFVYSSSKHKWFWYSLLKYTTMLALLSHSINCLPLPVTKS